MEAIQLVKRFLEKRGFTVEYADRGGFDETALAVRKTMIGGMQHALGRININKLKIILQYSPRDRKTKRRSVSIDKTFDLHDPNSLPNLVEALNSVFTLLTIDQL